MRFAEIAVLPDERIDLAEAALWIAAEEQPGLDPAPWLARLDEMADRLRPRLEPAPATSTGWEPSPASWPTRWGCAATPRTTTTPATAC